jgi:hypothetical protein
MKIVIKYWSTKEQLDHLKELSSNTHTRVRAVRWHRIISGAGHKEAKEEMNKYLTAGVPMKLIEKNVKPLPHSVVALSSFYETPLTGATPHTKSLTTRGGDDKFTLPMNVPLGEIGSSSTRGLIRIQGRYGSQWTEGRNWNIPIHRHWSEAGFRIVRNR